MKLKKLAEDIKNTAIELAVEYFENPDDNIEFSFLYKTKNGCELFVNAVCEVINYNYNSGDYYSPPEIDYDVRFLNANVEDHRINITNELNEYLN